MRIFNYQTLAVSLESGPKLLKVEILEQPNDASLGIEFLFELETLLSWCTQRIEINTIFITSQSTWFARGLAIPHGACAESIERLTQKIRKINYALLHLPQTVIFDLKRKAHGLAAELSLGADLRVAGQDIDLRFNHVHEGLMPKSGGVSFLSELVSPTVARNWLMSGAPIDKRQLLSSGLVYRLYSEQKREIVLTELFYNLTRQAPVQRIQTKAALLDNLNTEISAQMKKEDHYAKAAMKSEDWRRGPGGEKEFMPAKNFSKAVKLSLVDSDDAKH